MNRSSVLAGTLLALACWVGALAAAPTAAPATRPIATATGHFRLTFTDRSPHSTIEGIAKRRPFDMVYQATTRHTPAANESKPWDYQYDLAKESFEVYVPPAIKPTTPFGLFVWISPGEAVVPPAWFDVFNRHNLIYISPNKTGNARQILIRAGLALDAAHNMTQRYNIDPQRVYISGFSGGGGIASDVIHAFPDVFSGAYPMAGGAFYGGMKDENGRWQTGLDSQAWEAPVDKLKKSLKLVILEGQVDPMSTPGGAPAEAQAFQLDGFERVTGIEVPQLAHNVPSAAWFEKGIVALDAPPQTPPDVSPTKDPHPSPSQIAQAQRILVTAQERLVGGRQRGISAATLAKVHGYLQRILDDYPTTPAAAKARTLLADLDASVTTRPTR